MDEFFFFGFPNCFIGGKCGARWNVVCGGYKGSHQTVGILGQRESNVRKRAPPYKIWGRILATPDGWIRSITITISFALTSLCRTSVCSPQKTSSLTTHWVHSRINQRLIRLEFGSRSPKTVAAAHFLRRHHRFPDSFGQLCSPHWRMNDSSRQFNWDLWWSMKFQAPNSRL